LVLVVVLVADDIMGTVLWVRLDATSTDFA
jgi:hypothetical protein